MRTSLIFLLVLAGSPAAAQIHEAPVAIEAKVAPGGFEELCFELDRGQAMRYAFDADAELDFNLHWHRGNEVLYPLKLGAVARLAGVFKAPEKQAYCLMWTNREKRATLLRARIDRAE
jgi:hypothetical protein